MPHAGWPTTARNHLGVSTDRVLANRSMRWWRFAANRPVSLSLGQRVGGTRAELVAPLARE